MFFDGIFGQVHGILMSSFKNGSEFSIFVRTKGCYVVSWFYRDFKNKLHKVNGVFRPLQCFKLPEILCSIITRVAFLKIENKKMTIGQVEEL